METGRFSDKKVIKIKSDTITVERQVQFVLAIMVLVGIILGNSFSQWCYMLGILAGFDLLIASLNGNSPLSFILAKLPWNK